MVTNVLRYMYFTSFLLCSPEGTLGGLYDADGDGDFDVEDAKVLLGKWGFFSCTTDLLFILRVSLYIQ